MNNSSSPTTSMLYYSKLRKYKLKYWYRIKNKIGKFALNKKWFFRHFALVERKSTYLVDKAFLKVLGERVREVRKEHGYTQEKLANLIDVDISQISRLERGVSNVNICLIKEIATELDISLEELFRFKY